MVLITVKSGNDAQFLFECPAATAVEDCRDKIRDIYNARLKVERIATEIDQLAQYGTILPDNMQGLNDDQIAELKEIFAIISKTQNLEYFAYKCSKTGQS